MNIYVQTVDVKKENPTSNKIFNIQLLKLWKFDPNAGFKVKGGYWLHFPNFVAHLN